MEINRSKMLVFPRNGAIHRELYLNRKREFICTDRLMSSEIINKGDVVLDVGANIGYYALIESRIVGENGKVYAIEPVRDNFRLLEKNINLNHSSNVQAFQLAFGDKNEECKIYLSNCCNLCSMRKDSLGGKSIGAQDIMEETVDTFLKDKSQPSLIRMDVEGFEYEIIRGMSETLKGNVKILLELHPRYLGEEKLDEIFKIMRQNNFAVRFAIFEPKTDERKFSERILNDLRQKGGVTSTLRPFVVENVSLEDLQSLLRDCRTCIGERPFAWDILVPNVLFEKTSSLQH